MSQINPDRDPGTGQDRTEDLLTRALRGDLSGPVDSASLLTGARTRAVRLRRRRAVTSTAAVLVVPALAIGLNSIDLPGRGPQAPAAPITSASGSVPAPTLPDVSLPTSAATTRPSPTRTALTWKDDGTVDVPDEAMLGEDSLGEDYQKLAESDSEDETRTTGRSPCASLSEAESLAVGGRSMTIGQPDPDESMPDEWTLHTATRVFSGNGAEDQLRWLRENLTDCEPADGSMDTPLRVAEDSDATDTTLVATRVGVSPRHPDSITVYAAVRVGRATTGFVLFTPARVGEDRAARENKALSTAMGLLSLARSRLESSGLGPLSAQDSRLGSALPTSTSTGK